MKTNELYTDKPKISDFIKDDYLKNYFSAANLENKAMQDAISPFNTKVQGPKESFWDFFNNDGFKNATNAAGMLGNALGGIGGVLAAREQRKFNKKVLNMQERQAQRLMNKEDRNEKAINDGFSAFLRQRKEKNK